ncbi:hypothetical protein G432_07805 [Sphingomonas sp. MM-1]|nr:hypothetical protein G432_07805 [Sphingomonas sp. MM-1]
MTGRSIAAPLQTLFAELLQQAETTDPAGSVYERTRDGITYLYAKLPVGTTRVDRFLGRADDAAAVALAEAMRQGAAQARERRSLVAMLKRGGLAGPDRRLGAALDAIAYAGLFRGGAVLVGTAAYMMSGPLVGHLLPAPTLMTGDLDLATASLALSADPPERMEAILRRADPSFQAIMPLDPGNPASRFRSGDGYLVDLVTPQRSRADPNPKPLKALEAGAAPLQHLAWLIADPVASVALWGAGIPVTIPQPARFAVHKLILAQRREGAHRLKRAKDLAQAQALMAALQRFDPFLLEDALDSARAMGKAGWADPIDRSLKEIARSANP